MTLVHSIATWTIVAVALAAIIVRPRGLPEWIAALLGAAALVLTGLISPAQTFAAIGRGSDVYLFLAGMLVLAEVAREAGVFDWIAARALGVAVGSRMRFFALVYGACVAVTVVLSNDATAVVLTPAVAAAVRRARVAPLPYLFACAFVANAASFVLPISNPANLVIFGHDLPALGPWLAAFLGPSLAAIGATFAALVALSRRDLRGTFETPPEATPLARAGRIALGGIGLAATALAVASFRGAPLGITTAVASALVVAGVAAADRRLVKTVASGVSWSVIPLVAGLFVLVAAIDRTGFLHIARDGLASMGRQPAAIGIFSTGIVTALISNVTNNLPAGLIAGLTLQSAAHARSLASATAIGIDLGPNLSVTGSLATVLWLAALRREGIAIGAGAFLRFGAIVMPTALVLALAALALATH